ncbi:MAG: fumarylacetoacetate hydrolase family protein [Deltaproteobacteria bacterium]|nr:fumarylacetoacetate hydrolase family protein [Deltaproteobacteria bacterium]
MLSPLSSDDVDAFASQLDQATLDVRAIVKLTATKPFTLAEAYAIQRAGIALRKLRSDDLVGMKMGLTSRAKMQQMKVDVPIYGHLTKSMILDDGGTVLRARHVHPRVEPEVAFILKHDLEGPVTPAQALAAVDCCCCALELIDSRFENFQFTLEDVVADNASSSRFVLGSLVRPRDFDTGNLGMVMTKNGVVVETGSSAAIYEHPARSLAAMANQLVPLGEKLKAGMIVMTGGATAAMALAPGDHARVDVDGLGSAELFVA